MEIAAIETLEQLCSTVPVFLREMSPDEFLHKAAPGKWSKKEILGHLIDSATHHHHKLIRGQIEEKPYIAYDQDKWTSYSFYQNISTEQLINFWTLYNLQLVELVKQIPVENLQRICRGGDGNEKTLLFLTQEYVVHLLHHLDAIKVPIK